jgi:hypothetical protein
VPELVQRQLSVVERVDQENGATRHEEA